MFLVRSDKNVDTSPMELGTPDRSPSLGNLLSILGATGLRLASSEHGRELAATSTAVYDPHGDLEPTPGGVLLGVGIRPSAPGSGHVPAWAAARGLSAVVVKAYGDDVSALAEAADAAGIALLVVHDDVEWLRLDALVNNALAGATRTGRSLASVAIGDLFTLAGAIADSVGGATAIEDLSQQVLAYSADPRHPTDEERREGILGRQVPDAPENAEQYRALYRAPGVVRYPPGRGLGRVAVAVRAGKELLGSLWVVEPEEGLRDGAEEALRGAAPIAALHLLRAQSSQDLVRQQRGDATRRLVEGTADAGEAAALLGLADRGPYAVLAFAPAQLDDALSASAERLLPMVTLHCETRLGRTGSALIDGMVVVVADGSALGSPAMEALARETVAAARSSLRIQVLAGLVPSVETLRGLPAARTRAGRVLDLLRQRDDLGPVASADGVSDQLALTAHREAVRGDDRFVALRARQILEHDAGQGTSYGSFLLGHLRARMDVGRTAARLGLHPNTVRYRLRRASQLFDLDLADPEQVLPLWLALHAFEDAVVGASAPSSSG
jgi:hypothetical protein